MEQAINVFFLIQDDEHKEGIPLTEEDPQEDEDLNEVKVNQSKQQTLSSTGNRQRHNFRSWKLHKKTPWVSQFNCPFLRYFPLQRLREPRCNLSLLKVIFFAVVLGRTRISLAMTSIWQYTCTKDTVQIDLNENREN